MDILVVEDERIISIALAMMLRHLGHRVAGRVASAEAALSFLEASRPDLIIMDIKLEGEMDGIEAARQVRERWGIPVAFSSAFTDEATRNRAAAADPVAFIPKPVDEANLGLLFRSLQGA